MENREKKVSHSEDANQTSGTEEQGYMFDKMMVVEETEYDPREKSSSIHKEEFEEEPSKKPSFTKRYHKFIQ
jgi:hypothetical protein